MQYHMDTVYQEIAKLMAGLKHCVALTGAGISAESGIATFRSKGGLREKYDPMVYASMFIRIGRKNVFLELGEFEAGSVPARNIQQSRNRR